MMVSSRIMLKMDRDIIFILINFNIEENLKIIQ